MLRRLAALGEQAQRHELRDGQALHVERAAPVDDAVADLAGERRKGPARRIGRHDVHVVEQDDRLAGGAAASAAGGRSGSASAGRAPASACRCPACAQLILQERGGGDACRRAGWRCRCGCTTTSKRRGLRGHRVPVGLGGAGACARPSSSPGRGEQRPRRARLAHAGAAPAHDAPLSTADVGATPPRALHVPRPARLSCDDGSHASRCAGVRSPSAQRCWRSPLGARGARRRCRCRPRRPRCSSPGGTARVCVMLSSDDEQVAGIQTDIRWDGTCATLTVQGSLRCGRLARQGRARRHRPAAPTSPSRVLVLSLTDVDAIPDGPVFCCDFQGEAEPGSCCRVSLTNAGASDPGWQRARRSTLARRRRSARPDRAVSRAAAFGSPSGQGPLSASNAPPPGDGGAARRPPAPAAAAAPAGARAGGTGPAGRRGAGREPAGGGGGTADRAGAPAADHARRRRCRLHRWRADGARRAAAPTAAATTAPPPATSAADGSAPTAAGGRATRRPGGAARRHRPRPPPRRSSRRPAGGEGRGGRRLVRLPDRARARVPRRWSVLGLLALLGALVRRRRR